MNQQISTGFKGMLMGIAEAIPGVSGGTIALITGIYFRLIAAIKRFDFSVFKLFKEEGFKATYQKLDGSFLLSLTLGMLVGLLSGVFGVSYLLEHYPEPLWSFFFGLILASCFYIIKQIQGVGIKEIVLLILGAIIAFGITSISPVQGSDNLVFVFFAGMIAISALILPGISGSFILLILGLYTVIITTLKGFLSAPSFDSFVLLTVFSMGCLTGLVLFSRVLSWTFKHYEKPTLALLTGFMFGSLNKIWPWRMPVKILDKDQGSITTFVESQHTNILNNDAFKILSEIKVLPGDYGIGTPKTGLCIIAVIVGVLTVLVMSKFENKINSSQV